MGRAQSLKVMPEVIDAFYGKSWTNKCSLVVQAGNIFAESQGKSITAEFFLRNFLVEHLNKGRYFQSRMDSATEGLQDEEEKTRLVNEILEDCFVFLAAFRSRVCLETRWVLEAIEVKRPHPRFLKAVEDKAKASKMNEAA